MTKPTRRNILSAAPLIVSPAAAFTYQANSKIGFGVIGTGGRGQYVGELMTRDPNSRIAAICDKYPDRIDAGKTNIPGADKVPAYKDYRQLLNDKSIDAVLISTPVFLHPEHYEAAINAKKHIYCEKPAALAKRSRVMSTDPPLVETVAVTGSLALAHFTSSGTVL